MDFIAGCIGGTAGCLVSHPFDTIKVRMQCQPKGTYKGVFNCLSQTVKHETYRGLYKGLAAPLCTLSFINAMCFGTFGYLLKKSDNPTTVKSHFIAGVGTGMVLSVVTCPIDLLKCKMQMQGIASRTRPKVVLWGRPPVYTFRGPLECMRTIYVKEGVVGLNRGMLVNIVRRSPGFGLYFATNEFLQQLYIGHHEGVEMPPVWYTFIAGGISGCVPWAVLYPFDVIKSRMQCDGVYNPLRKRFTYKYTGYADCIRRSVKLEGYSLFYRGLTSTFLRTFPNNGVILTVVSFIRNFYTSSEDLELEL